VTYQFTPLAVASIINGCIAVVFALFGWSRRGNPGGRPFVLLMLAAGEWSLSWALEAAAMEPAAKIFWAKTAYLGIATTGLFWLLFAVGFARKDKWFTGKRLMGLAVIPVVTIVMAFTNSLHGLIWTSITPGTLAGYNLLIYRHGPWFWVMVAYSYTTVIVGTVLLLAAFRYYTRLYRLQAFLLVIAAALPLIGNALYVSGLTPYPGLDLTHFGFTGAALIFSLTVFRYRMFDLQSFARNVAVEKMSDGFLAMDEVNKIIDMNPAAVSLFGSPAFLALGLSVEAAAVKWSEMTSVLDGAQQDHLEIILGDRTYKIHSSAVEDQSGQMRGRVLFIIDATG
jgi:PAS domain-containing protein